MNVPDSRSSWLRLAVCTLISTIGGVGMWSFVVMLPAIQADFGITRGEASLPYTVLMVGFALGSIVTGRLADRFGIRLTLVIGSLAAGLGFVLGGLTTTPWQLTIAYRLLEPALGIAEPVRLICHEGNFRDLLGQLSVQRIDLVIADEPMGRQIGVKAFSHTLGTTAMSFFATAPLRRTLVGEFPACLDHAPMLIQGATSAARQRLDLWLAEHRLRPRLIGEFDDAALLKAFGGEGRGVFMTPEVLEEETRAQYGVEVIGRAAELIEEFFAISVERRITHPCVVAITKAARGRFRRRRGSAK